MKSLCYWSRGVSQIAVLRIRHINPISRPFIRIDLYLPITHEVLGD
jgi:hypothetical protein